MRTLMIVAAVLGAGLALGDEAKPKMGKEMAEALAVLDQSLGLESYPKPHCLQWGFHQITPEEVKACVDQAIKAATLPELGKSYSVAVLMSAVGPQTLIAIALDAPGWAVLSCDPGKPCPPRKAGTDKMGKRVIDRMDRACKNSTTIWVPEKKGCP